MSINKRALIVGIDHYGGSKNLSGCVNDANKMDELLSTNSDGSKNFSTKLLTSTPDKKITASLLKSEITKLLSRKAEVVVIYFAGHGYFDESIGKGYLVTPEGTNANPGLDLSVIVNLVNKASPSIGSTVVILDSCQSGAMGDALDAAYPISAIPEGMTIITACERDDYAQEIAGRGKFTALLTDGLTGAAADVLGRITPASLYSLVDQTLGAFEQRPVYKANVEQFIELRKTEPKVEPRFLRTLHKLFSTPEEIYPLDPSCEPLEDRPTDAGETIKSIPFDEKKSAIYRKLQDCNRVGLVVPVDEKHMYWAAINSTGCKLTEIGKHYRKLAELGAF